MRRTMISYKCDPNFIHTVEHGENPLPALTSSKRYDVTGDGSLSAGRV
jgi:hypothetical protein